MKAERVNLLNEKRIASVSMKKHSSVVYWMSREQRVKDNWGLIFASQLAIEKGLKLNVIFCLADNFLGATLRQYDFLLKGLAKVEKALKERNIPFVIKTGSPEISVLEFINETDAGYCVTDFDPLRIKREWTRKIIERIEIPLFEVDSHNIVPARFVSNKQEFGAYTIRPKIKKHLDYFLEEFPEDEIFPESNYSGMGVGNDYEKIVCKLEIDRTIKPVDSFSSGEDEALRILQRFLDKGIYSYDEKRNDPLSDSSSNLSPYLHFGQISSHRIALEINKLKIAENITASFLEELIIRKELSDNFCLYNENYDKFAGFQNWAQISLNKHRDDIRDYIYDLNKFEAAQTHDDLWNAAQNEMKFTGKMHGYLRMYWAKKILEWTDSPEKAMRIAIYLNDKYELDGRDPNGYTGIAWSIGGVHDRAWFEREVYGKIRYMNYNGCKKKFDVKAYINKFSDTYNKD